MAAPSSKRTGSIVLPDDFNLASAPTLDVADCKDKDSHKLANYFSDLKNPDSDAKELRRSACAELRELAMAYTLYFRHFVKVHRESGVGRLAYAAVKPVDLPDGSKEYLKREAFRWRFNVFLKAHNAKNINSLVLPDICTPILRLANDQLVNPGARFQVNDGQTLMVLAALHHYPKSGYRSLHQILSVTMCQPSFEFKGIWPCPTEKQIRSIMRDVPPALRLYLAKGHKALYARFGLALSREYGDLNHVWAGDAFFLNDAPFFDPQTPHGKRLIPAFSYLIEHSTRHLVSYDLSLQSPNGLTGLKVLREGMLEKTETAHLWPLHGKPDAMLSDNRAPFGSSVVVKAAQKLEIQVLRIRPGHSSQNGTAERFGRTAKYRIMAHIKIHLKKEFPRLNRRNPISITQWERFMKIVHGAIVDYHHRQNRILKMSPWEACQQALDKAPIKKLDEKAVIRMTSFSGIAAVQKQGMYVYKHWFIAPEMMELEGGVAEWIYDPFNSKPQLIIQEHGHIICTAPVADPGANTGLRESLKGSSLKLLQSRIAEIGKEVLAVEGRTNKRPSKAVEQTRLIRGFRPELEIPEAITVLPDLFSRITRETS